ncbi:MAG: flagellar hook-length control protein FliK [Magnetovibrio sp.]|nr:flagellar hook-length control protein FliK [Magnetovibrio sp.]
MDVSAANRNYVDTNANTKTNISATDQLIGDFSAAVAERMNQAGHSGAGKGKMALVGSLTSGSQIRAKQSPDAHITDTPPPADRNEAPAPQDRVDAPEHRSEAPARDDVVVNEAPRDVVQNDIPTNDHGSDTQQASSGEDQSSNEQLSQNDGGQQQATESTDTGPQDGTANTEAQAAAVQQANVGQVAQVLTNSTPKGTTVKAAATEGGPKQQAQQGAELAQNVAGGQNAGDPSTEVADLGATTEGAKTKSGADGAKSGANTHVAAEVQAEANKGATLAQQQAADIAKKIGPNQALNVNVSVTKQSEELVSLPAASLAGQANIKAEGESLTPTTMPAATKAQGPQVATHNTGGQGGADAQGQGQQQAQLQAAQADAAKLAASVAEAKTTQSANTNTTTQTAKVGGAEGITNTQAVAPVANTQQTQQTAQPATKPQTQAQAQAQTSPTEQVKVQIAKAISDGVDQIRIQLKPAHLGRIDIQLEMSQDGRVAAVISADSKDTMDMLKQDSQELERALREAGLNLNSGDLSFSMRGEGGNASNDGEMAQGNSKSSDPILEPTLSELMEMNSGQPQIITEDRVDITA